MMLRTNGRACAAVVTMLAVFVVCAPLCAQTDTGRILGSVLDQSQTVVVGAAVTVTDTQRGLTRNLTSNESGEYLVTNLLPGVYMVRVAALGFRNVERKDIALERQRGEKR